jgi:hypothetical protein
MAMTQDFIKEKGLGFIEAPEIGDFWGGDDACGDHTYELFITAGEAGPASIQIERYQSLCNSFDSIYNAIRERYASHLSGLDTGQRKKWHKVPVRVLFVNVNDDSKDCEIELTCSASRGFFIFARHLNFLGKLRNNRLVSFEII